MDPVRLWDGLVTAWTTFAAHMETRDWIDLAIALGTIALALATFRLAGFARRSARDSAAALEAFRVQAKATESLAKTTESLANASNRHADLAASTLDEQRRQFGRQTRTHMVLVDAEKDGGNADVREDLTIAEDRGLAVVVTAKLKNVSPVLAYVDRVEGDNRIRVALVVEPYVPAGGATTVELFFPAKVDEEINTMMVVTTHYSSMASGEAGQSEASLTIYGRIRRIANDGGPVAFITSREFQFDGYAYVVPLGKTPGTSGEGGSI